MDYCDFAAAARAVSKETDFGADALHTAVRKSGKPEIVNNNQGFRTASFTRSARLRRMGVRVLMDGDIRQHLR